MKYVVPDMACCGTASYPQHTLTEAWKRFIFHQFHDDLTGTSIPRAYEFSWNDELISLKQFSQVLTSSVNAIAGQMDTRVKGTPVVLYNACKNTDSQGCVSIYFTLYYLGTCWYFPNRQNKKSLSKTYQI